MSAATIHKASMLTGRHMVFAAVVGLHVLAIMSLMTMRIPVDEKVMPGFKSITLVPPVEAVPPPPELQIDPTPKATTLRLPEIDGPVITPEVVPGIPIDARPLLPQGGEVVAGQPDGAVVIPSTELRSRATRSPDDYYPATSLQLQEEGVATVRVCVGPTGRMEGLPVVAASSGIRRLDAAAVKWASEALAFTPATRNGAAVSACRDYRVRFSLK